MNRGKLKAPSYVVNRSTVRPFRIIDERRGVMLPRRAFAFHDNALDRALELLNWSKVGTAFAVVKVDEAEKLIGQFALQRNGDITRYVHPHWHYKRAPKSS